MTVILSLPKRDDESHFSVPSRPGPSLNSIAVVLVLVGLLAASIWSTIDLGINVASIVDSIDNAVTFTARMFPLDFPPLGELIGLIVETMAIVILATVLAVLISLPIALAAAWNTTSGNISRGAARVTIVLARAIPDLILAVFFFRVFGLGALPGILAMGLHSIGMVGKLYADAIESLDNGPQEAIRAAGGGRMQQIIGGILPPLMPQLIATALHRFDINLRTSIILGYVGVGGLGLAISDALRSLNYQRGMALALIVLLLCIATELTSGAIRTAIMQGGTTSAAKRGPVAWADKVSRNWVSGGRAGQGQDARDTPPWTSDRIRRFLSIAALAVIIAVSIARAEFSWQSFTFGLENLPNTLSLFFPPGDGGIMSELLEQMLVTIQIALSATLLGTIAAVPIGILAARNVIAHRGVHSFFRVLIVCVRGVPELIVAIIFVVITGLGGVAGTLALALGAVGLLSKLIADSLEETDLGPQDAIRTNGATTSQVFFAATIRQAAPAFVTHIMYLLDSNIRAATLLGIVGAGGIGFYLLNASRVMQFDVVTTIVLIILVVVLAVEALSIWIRRSAR